MLKPTQAHNYGKYDSNETGWYFRVDYNNKMSYKYILPIP